MRWGGGVAVLLAVTTMLYSYVDTANGALLLALGQGTTGDG